MVDLGAVIHILVSLDEFVLQMAQSSGIWAYVLLALIVFFETGVVITPFLPGDSLLFAAGAVAAIGGLKLTILIPLLFLAAVVGDGVNYTIGKIWGRRLINYAEKRRFIINYKHIQATESFYAKYGGKAIIIARFIPIIRTFAPFIAGIAMMNYRRFLTYNIVGAAIWVILFVMGGYVFGNIPVVKENFSLVILAIIILSCIPALIQVLKVRNKK